MSLDIQSEIIRDIAHAFLTDAYEFIERAESMAQSSTRPSFRAKILADITLSVECSLKSLMASSANEGETAVSLYRRIRRKGHKLLSLLDGIRDAHRSVFRLSAHDTNAVELIATFSAQFRYSIDYGGLMLGTSRSIFLEDLSEAFLGRTSDHLRLARRIYNEATKAYKARYPRSIRLGGHRAQDYKMALRRFHDEIKRPNRHE
jgi:hypothetical protein